MAPRSSAALAQRVVERGGQLVPCPLLSRGCPVVGAGVRLEDRGLEAAALAPGEEPWVALQLGVGPARVLLSWVPAAGSPLPHAHWIETCARSSDGRSGSWRLELAEPCEAGPSARVLEYDGQSFVRIRFAPGAGAPLALARLDAHDASDGTDDVWLVLGDEAARAAFEPAARDGRAAPGVPELLHREYPGYYPAVLVEAAAGLSPRRALERLERVLARHPHARRVALSWAAAAEEDASALVAIADLVRRGGRVPIFAHLPSSARAAVACNEALQAIELSQELLPGPELEGLGPFEPGGVLETSVRAELQRRWAAALDVFYVPQ